MKEQKISIIIPSYRNQNSLKKCIHRIKESACGNYEIIVIDNDFGPAKAKNLGAKRAQGEFFLFVDNDVVLNKTAYREILLSFQGTNFDCVQGIYSTDVPYNNFCSKYKNVYWNFNQLHSNSKWFSICSAIFAIKRTTFEEIGGFNAKSLNGEDKELGIKLEKKGKNILLNKKVQGTHYKKFDFLSLLKYHFQNSVNCTLLFLKTDAMQQKKDWAKRYQLIGMLLSPIIVFLAICSIFSIRFLVYVIIGFLILFLWAFDFIRYSYSRFGIKFSFLSFWMYFLEGIVACGGVLFGIFRFILRKKELNFKI